ncbi:MAG: lysophospholipase L1-like esterase [Planctomycetota bacterium]|jgi:lysophospholipase L1-like esterase
MPAFRRFLALALFPLLTASCGVSTQPVDAQVPVVQPIEPAAVPEVPAQLDAMLFRRLVILGSSASDGFNLQLETGAPTRLADYFEAGLLVDHQLAYDGATSATFMNPEKIAGRAVDLALEADPSLLVAVDFLFWFYYGSGGVGNTVEFRRQRLEVGMAMLDRFDCPILVGDLPNMSGAAGGMIPMASMPPADSFASANERVRAWASAKTNVTIVPLASFNESAATGLPFQVGGVTWDPALAGGLLQFDKLHPNLAGTAILALQSLLSLAETFGASLEGIMMTDPEQLVDAVDDLIAAR